jgi:hypothetical protein
MLRKYFVPILALLTLTIGVPVAAQGAVVNIVDARGDVRRMDANGHWVKADGEQRADILRTRIQHTDHALLVRTKLDRLAREGRRVAMAMRIRTNDGTGRIVQLEAGRRIGWRGQTMIDNRRGSAVQCRTSHAIDYANDVMMVRIPSSCLGNPRWVQATLVTVFLGGRTFLADNPHNTTMRIGGVWTRRIGRA